MNIHVAVHAVTKTFTRGAGVQNVSCDATEHEIVGIAGRNGAGKSTLVRIICGALRPASGSVTVTIDGSKMDPDHLQDYVGLVAPYLALYDEFTPRELFEIIARLRGLEWSDEKSTWLLDRVALSHVGDRISHGFSSGMMQRLRLAVAIQHRPPLLMLDEPTSNLDEEGVTLVKDIVDEQQRHGIVFLASNDPRELAWCTKIVNVEEARLNSEA